MHWIFIYSMQIYPTEDSDNTLNQCCSTFVRCLYWHIKPHYHMYSILCMQPLPLRRVGCHHTVAKQLPKCVNNAECCSWQCVFACPASFSESGTPASWGLQLRIPKHYTGTCDAYVCARTHTHTCTYIPYNSEMLFTLRYGARQLWMP